MANGNSGAARRFRSEEKGYRDGGIGGQGGASPPPPDVGKLVNPISTRGGRLCTHINTRPPEFQTFRLPWDISYV